MRQIHFQLLKTALIAVAVISFTACVKKSDQDNATPPTPPVPSGPVVADVQNRTNPLLEPAPMKLCVRPAHRLGLKKCVRNGKWVRLNVAANDVDNDRTDVFTNPRISLKKENFYPETFSIQDGLNEITNYPDYYHTHAHYGRIARLTFAMPNQADLPVTYGYSGRDEIRDNLKRSLSQMNSETREYVKIQHWNDGRVYKKHAAIYFEILGDYSETNYRYWCTWGEQEQGYDFSQIKTKDGADVPKIPETWIWRKVAESCENLPSTGQPFQYRYLPFKDVGPNPISTEHKFTGQNRNKIRTYNVMNILPEEVASRSNTVLPVALPALLLNGTNSIFTTEKKEEISRWESIYDEDLKDLSFQPERQKL